MGVLDDAIREHIELQRLHGASEEDLSRKEREALGPARRETPTPAEESDEGPADLAPDGAGADTDEDFDRHRTRVLPQPDPEDLHEWPAPTEPETALTSEPEHAPIADEDDLFADDEPFAEPAVEGDVVDAEVLDEEEDVLEETPEFLQETPEHDRLWFEQKPPRDFDFGA